jgi:MFS family permease
LRAKAAGRRHTGYWPLQQRQPSAAASGLPAPASLYALDAVNFFIAGALAGFGPFVAVFLANRGWLPKDIGFVLSAGAMAALVAQLPGGELIDAVRSKRLLVAVGSVMVALAAVIIALRPDLPMVLAALMVQGIAGGLIGPAIAAMSLGLVGHALLAERLGRNQSFKSAGSLLAAALMASSAISCRIARYFSRVPRSRFRPCWP